MNIKKLLAKVFYWLLGVGVAVFLFLLIEPYISKDEFDPSNQKDIFTHERNWVFEMMYAASKEDIVRSELYTYESEISFYFARDRYRPHAVELTEQDKAKILRNARVSSTDPGIQIQDFQLAIKPTRAKIREEQKYKNLLSAIDETIGFSLFSFLHRNTDGYKLQVQYRMTSDSLWLDSKSMIYVELPNLMSFAQSQELYPVFHPHGFTMQVYELYDGEKLFLDEFLLWDTPRKRTLMSIFGTVRVFLVIFGFIMALGLIAYPLVLLFDNIKDRVSPPKTEPPLPSIDEMTREQKEEMIDKWEQEAIAYYEQQEYAACLFSVEKAIEAGTQNAYAYNLAAQACLLMDHNEEGEKYARKAIELEPREPSHLLLLPGFLFKNNRASECLDVYQRALTLNPDENTKPVIYMGIANAHNRLGNREKFYDYMQEALTLNPRLVLAWKETAWALYQDRQFEVAKQAIHKALEVEPKDPQSKEILQKIEAAIKEAK